MAPPCTGPVVTRRQLLVAGAGAVLAAACGGSGEERAATTTTPAEGHSLLRFFPDGQPTGMELRLAFGLTDADGVPLQRTPGELEFTVAPQNGEPGPAQLVARHDAGIPRPYYPVKVTFQETGVHSVLAEWDSGTARSAVTAVVSEKAPPVPGPGDPMISLPTPTVEEPLGVDPICTREPACALHDVSLDRALEAGRPLAFLISSPAFCQVRICGPVLDVLLEHQSEFGDRVTMIHNEVYTSRDLKQTTDAVQAYKLPSEPILFLAGADGVIRERLDNIYDEVELRASLERLVS